MLDLYCVFCGLFSLTLVRYLTVVFGNLEDVSCNEIVEVYDVFKIILSFFMDISVPGFLGLGILSS